MLAKRFSRLLALLTLFCYGGFALIGSCLHTDAPGESDAAPATSNSVPGFASSARSAAPAVPVKGTAIRAAAKTHHCLVCDWQQANVSAALLPVQFVYAYLPQTDNPAAAPRAPSASGCVAASRGPPSA